VEDITGNIVIQCCVCTSCGAPARPLAILRTVVILLFKQGQKSLLSCHQGLQTDRFFVYILSLAVVKQTKQQVLSYILA